MTSPNGWTSGWTPERLRLLHKALFEERLPVAEAAALLGVTKKSAMGVARRRNWGSLTPPHAFTTAEVETIRRMAPDHSASEIISHLRPSRHAHSISHWCLKHGVQIKHGDRRVQPSRFWTPELEKTAAELWMSGMSSTEVAEKIGCTRGTVMGKMRRLNLSRPRNNAERTLTARMSRGLGPSSPVTPKPVAAPVSATPAKIHDIAPLDLVPANATPLHLLPDNGCRWPFGEGPETVFCGAPMREEAGRGCHSRYCTMHQLWSQSHTVQKMRSASGSRAPTCEAA